MELSPIAEMLRNFLIENDVKFTKIQSTSSTQQESEATGKLDSAPHEWDSFINHLISTETAPILNPAEEVKAIRSQLFDSVADPDTAEDIDTHLETIDLKELSKENISAFRFKHHPLFILLYGMDLVCHFQHQAKLIDKGDDWILLEFERSANPLQNIVGITIDETLIHLLFTPSEVISHCSTIPPFPEVEPPTFLSLPKTTPSLLSKALILGYAIRYGTHLPSLERHPTSYEEQLQALLDLKSSPPKISKYYQNAFESIFNAQVRTLEKNIPTERNLDAKAIEHWLIHRDQVESIFTIIGRWRPALREKLQQIDSQFPLHLISSILPNSRLLMEAWHQDPTCWWGQGAALHMCMLELTE